MCSGKGRLTIAKTEGRLSRDEPITSDENLSLNQHRHFTLI